MSEELSVIVQELKNSDPEIRENALDKIGTLKPSNALDIIQHFLSDSDPEVRGTAACNLGEIRDRRAVPYLINVARFDSQEEVRADALLALAEYRSSEILNCLVVLLCFIILELFEVNWGESDLTEPQFTLLLI